QLQPGRELGGTLLYGVATRHAVAGLAIRRQGEVEGRHAGAQHLVERSLTRGVCERRRRCARGHAQAGAVLLVELSPQRESIGALHQSGGCFEAPTRPTIVTVETARRRLTPALVSTFLGDHVDDTQEGVSAVERRGRAFDDFDPLYAGHGH